MKLLNINSKRVELFDPLLKWRILGCSELGALSNYQGTTRSLRKFLQRAENDGLINSFIHKFHNRKFFYLTRNAYRELAGESWNINEEIKMHDAIVSILLYQFSLCEFVSLAELNYQNIELNKSIFASRVDPDAMIRAKKNNEFFNISIEVELTRKNSIEIFKKFSLYEQNTSFTWVLYFFSNSRVMDSYFKYYNNFREEKKIDLSKSQIMFLYSEEYTSLGFNLLDCMWLRPDGAKSQLKEFFYAL